MNIAKIGVIGAGLMGNGITHAALLSGYDVTLIDAFEAALPKAIATMTKNMDRQVTKRTITAEAKDEALKRLVTSTDLQRLQGVDLVIEAVPEQEALKEQLYRQIAPLLRPETILASNTSSLPITRLATLSGRPDKFIGMHFFNPVPMMKLVEIIRGIATSDATFAAVQAVAEKLGKTVAGAEDAPGFIVNRILCPMINEAIFALQEGTGTVTAIDTGLKLGANHPMGPLELADFIGLDTLLAIMRVLHEGLGEDKYRPCPLLLKYVNAGWLGRKSGRGFYDYTVTPPRPTGRVE